ncbi:MAG: hypothetical protein ABIB47_05835 [Candidatus Woesearchaeota archaeon]
MNKRGIIVPMLALALLGIVLFALVVKDEVVTDAKARAVGKLSQDLIFEDILMEESVFYFEQRIKFETLKRFDGFLNKGGVLETENGVWDFNPYDRLIENLKKEMSKDFVFEVEKRPKLRGKHEVGIIEKDDTLLINVYYPEQITNVDSLKEGLVPRIFYNKTLNYTYEIDLDLKVFDGLYKRYSEWGKDKKCLLNEDLFEGFKVSCREEGDFLDFEGVTKDLGYVEPVIKFKIRKTGELFGG